MLYLTNDHRLSLLLFRTTMVSLVRTSTCLCSMRLKIDCSGNVLPNLNSMTSKIAKTCAQIVYGFSTPHDPTCPRNVENPGFQGRYFGKSDTCDTQLVPGHPVFSENTGLSQTRPKPSSENTNSSSAFSCSLSSTSSSPSQDDETMMTTEEGEKTKTHE